MSSFNQLYKGLKCSCFNSSTSPTAAAESKEMAELPDFMTNPNAVLNDKHHEWRYGVPPDYSKVNAAYELEKTVNHAEGSLEWLVSNLVKNWEKEMSYKLRADQIRTINHAKYRFSVNGKEWNNVEQMLQVGTYNALIGDTEHYKASQLSFSESHKLFKRALRVFSWEVIKVYSGPPIVAFKWRHWGLNNGDFTIENEKGDKIKSKASNELVEVFGVSVAKVNEKFEIEDLEVFFDPEDSLRTLFKNKEGVAASGCPIMK